MNHWHDEILSELHRQDLARELRELRLARAVRVSRARGFERSMLGLANWMISTGKQLRCRYDGPGVGRPQRPSGSFAR